MVGYNAQRKISINILV